jgi:hypothetical protein
MIAEVLNMMRLFKTASIVAVLAALSGCVAVPVGPGYYGGPPTYYDGAAYYGPTIGIGIYGGRSYGHRHWHH